MARIGTLLLERGVLSADQLAEAETRLDQYGGSLARTLIGMRLIDERQLVETVAMSAGMAYADVSPGSVDPAVAAMLPGETARELTALPVRIGDDDRVVVAVAEPTVSEQLRRRLHDEIGLPVTFALASRAPLQQAIAALAGTAPAPGSGAGPGPAQRPVANGAPGPAAPPAAPARPVASPRVAAEETPEIDLDQLLTELMELGGSDLHLTAGTPPVFRVSGDLIRPDGHDRLTPEQLQKVMYAIMTQKQRERFENDLELDFSYSVPGRSRFRVNVYQQRNSIGAALRVIPYEILELDKLGIPPQVANFAYLPRGFVLVTGPTGSGKSTTLASLIDLVNRNRPVHIMTVEDPIEFLHRHKRAVVNQREVGTDTHGFAPALKHVLRQDPDVILVGEMRDLETIQIALTAAETGHLVFGTLHTQDAPQTVDRIIDVFPPDQQEQVRVMLSGALRGVVSQALLKTADGKGRVAACEVMVATSGIRNLIREGKTHQIYSSIQAGAQHGMIAMDQSLAKLVKAGRIRYEEALEKAHDANEFNRLAGRA